MPNEKREKPRGGRKSRLAGKIALISGCALLAAVFVLLLVNALLNVFVKSYYPTFGSKRFFAVVTDSMEPEIPQGSLITCFKTKSESDIAVGDVITFERKQGNSVTLITHRVTGIVLSDSGASYVTKGDNAPATDAFSPSYSDVVGVYRGGKCGGLGYVIGFLQSSQGAIALILSAFTVAVVIIVVRFVNLVNVWRGIAVSALKKSGDILSESENEQIGTIVDVIGIVSKDPNDKKEVCRKDKKLAYFLKTGKLPKRPYSDDLESDNEQETENVTEETMEG